MCAKGYNFAPLSMHCRPIVLGYAGGDSGGLVSIIMLPPLVALTIYLTLRVIEAKEV